MVIGDPKLKEEEYQSLTDVIEYAEDGNKTVRDTERFVSGVNCDAETARQEMILAKNAFDKNDGICAYHAIQSFAPGRGHAGNGARDRYSARRLASGRCEVSGLWSTANLVGKPKGDNSTTVTLQVGKLPCHD